MADRSPRPLRAVVVAAALALGVGSIGCGGGGVGAPCRVDAECASSLLCVADPGLPEARCMRPCEPAVRLCDDGSVCMDLAGGRACYPGGTVGYMEPCDRNLDCEAGTVCPAAVRACAQACDEGLSVCLITEVCHADDAVGAICGPAVTP
jgi:hypothetical protein